jgi:hypothetical protein
VTLDSGSEGSRPFRVLVCGGRDFGDREAVYGALDVLRAEHGSLVVIEGGATGVDRLALDWVRRGEPSFPPSAEHLSFPADWNRYGRAAGALRNIKMLKEGKPDLVLAFNGGRGTANMVQQATRAGVEVRLLP